MMDSNDKGPANALDHASEEPISATPSVDESAKHEPATPSPAHVAFGEALRVLRFREDLGFHWFDTTACAKRKRFPDFLIIGAQKAGTTWLHANLNYHPNIWMAPIKEINYFNEIYGRSDDRWEEASRKTQANEAREFLNSLAERTPRQRLKLAALDIIESERPSDDWYSRIFSHAPDNDLCGESSPEYCALPRGAVAHIGSLNPKLKAIFLLRDPIDRLWSHIRMNVRDGYEHSIEQLRDDFIWRHFGGRSNYPEMIRRWRAALGNDNVILLNYDSIRTNPAGLLKQVCDAFGLNFDPRFFPHALDLIGKGDNEVMLAEVYALAKARMRFLYDELERLVPEMASAWTAKHFGLYAGPGPATTQEPQS